MHLLQKLAAALRRKPRAQEDLAAREEAQHIRDQVLDVRLSQERGGSTIYESGRGREE